MHSIFSILFFISSPVRFRYYSLSVNIVVSNYSLHLVF